MAEGTKELEAALDELLKGKKPEEIVGPNGLLKQLTKALLERAMDAELTHHLGYEKGRPEGRGSGNSRNGSSRKRVQGILGRSRSQFRATGTGASSRRFCPSTSAAGLVSTTKSYRCMRAA